MQEGTGIPLVFIHGFLGRSEDFRRIIAHLPGRLCYGADLFSPPAPDAISARDLGPCRLVGYSMGGRLAMRWALNYPSRVHSLVLLSAHYGLLDREEKKRRLAHDLIWAGKLLSQPFDEFLKEWYDQPIFASLQRKKLLLQEILMTRTSDDLLLLAKALLRHSLARGHCHRERLQTFPHPLLICYGTDDLKFKMLYDSWPQARAIPDAGHVLHFEQPEAIAELL